MSSKFIRNILITGSSRGIGYEFVVQYLNEPNVHVIATARNLSKATALQQLKQKHSNLELIEMDVSSAESVRTALKSLPPLSIVINNAGVIGDFNGTSAPVDDLISTFNTNVAGTFVTIQNTLDSLYQTVKKHNVRPVVVNISSSGGSIKSALDGAYNGGKGILPYRVSKAALNMLTATVAKEHPEITFISVNPGWVDTDMGRSAGPSPPLSPQDSVKSIRNLISNIKPEQSGHFIQYDGKLVDY